MLQKPNALCYLGQMPQVYEVRRANLRKLMTQWGGPTSLATKLGHSNGSYLAQLAGPHPSREVSERTARQIEQALTLPTGYLDQAHPGAEHTLDDDVLALCIRAVTAAVKDAKLKANPERFADLVALAYDHSMVSGTVDEKFINRIVRLLK
jgi:hypothetical protein